MAIFKPFLMLKSIFDITPELLSEMGIKALLLDVDNTMAIYHTDVPIDGIDKWIDAMKSSGIDLHILSNAKPKRLTRFANNVNLPFFCMSLKPLPFKINKAIKALGVKKSEVALVGDQMFTDILGGNLANIKTIWLEIIEPETKLSFKIKRKIEKIMRRKYSEMRDNNEC